MQLPNMMARRPKSMPSYAISKEAYRPWLPWLVSLILLAIVVFLYYSYSDPQAPPVRIWNRILATAGTVLAALSFLLGPVYGTFQFKSDPLPYRKCFGMVGFAMLALHTWIGFSLVSRSTFDPGNLGSIVSAAIAFSLFSILAATSSPIVMDGLGMERWVAIQRWGYAALAFSLLHIIWMNGGSYIALAWGPAVSFLVLLTIAWRMALLFRR